MRVNNWISFGCIIAAIAIGTAIAVMISDIATLKAEWCDARPACLRDWISALSGWAAGVGALIAACLALPHIRKQAIDTQRQADFAYGDASPTLDVVPDLDDPQFLVLRLVNWNRRTVVAKTVETVGTGDAELKIFDQKQNGQEIHDRGIYIRGWENRSGAPNVYQARFMLVKDGAPIERWPDDTNVVMTIQLIDKVHSIVKLRASLVQRPSTDRVILA